MWPFNKSQKPKTLEEAAALEPMPLCKQPAEHLNWRLNGITCPMCAGIRERSREAEAENRLAEKIATAVVRRMSARFGGDVLQVSPITAQEATQPEDGASQNKSSRH